MKDSVYVEAGEPMPGLRHTSWVWSSGIMPIPNRESESICARLGGNRLEGDHEATPVV